MDHLVSDLIAAGDIIISSLRAIALRLDEREIYVTDRGASSTGRCVSVPALFGNFDRLCVCTVDDKLY